MNFSIQIRSFFGWTCCLMGMFITASAFGADYYVDRTNGMDGPGRGSTPEEPWATINYAFDHISGSMANPHTIHIAAGIYSENVVADPHESLKGGYSPRFDAHDPDIYVTTMDGAGSGHTLVCASNAIIDGFTVTGGSSDNGGGVYCHDASSTVRNCRIESNVARDDGGGIYISGGNMTFEKCTVSGNVSTHGSGGGCFQTEGSTSFSQTRFEDNRGWGAAFYITSGTVTFEECHFLRNGTNHPIAGALRIWGSDAIIKNSIVADNTTAGILADGAGAVTIQDSLVSNNSGIGISYSDYSGLLTVDRSIIAYNREGNSNPGGISCYGTTVIRDTYFVNNTSDEYGGSRCAYLFSQSTVENCMVVGGGLFLLREWRRVGNVIVNNTFVRNHPVGLRIVTGNETIKLVNSLLYQNTDDIDVHEKVTGLQVSHCNIGDGDYNGENGTISVNPDFWERPDVGKVVSVNYSRSECLTSFNVSANSFAAGELAMRFLWIENTPYLIKANKDSIITVYGNASGSGHVGKSYSLADYHLQWYSLCVDAGTSSGAPDHDIEGESRPLFGYSAFQVDIGADEYNPERPDNQLPTDPVAQMTLAVMLSVPSTDPEGVPITYTVRWESSTGDIILRNGLTSVQGVLCDVLRETELLQIGQTWTAIITPSDGVGVGNAAVIRAKLVSDEQGVLSWIIY